MRLFYVFLFSIVLFTCSKENSKNQDPVSEWSIDEADVTGVLSLFPLALNPEFTSINNVNLTDDELVGVVNFGSEVRVYPYVYVNQNEIINDEFNGQKFAFSYCPLTKSSVAFWRDHVFRASGYLYKDNLTPWDELTESIWSQMLLKGIRGTKKNQVLNTLPILETRLGTIRASFPNAKIMVNQSFNNRRETPPDDDNVDNENSPELGELAYGILNNFSDIYIFKYNDFTDLNIITINIQSQDYIIYGDESRHVINAFKVSNSDNYQVIEGEFPHVFKNINGVKYDILGRGTNGIILEKPKYAYVAIWRAWDDFYDNFIFQ